MNIERGLRPRNVDAEVEGGLTQATCQSPNGPGSTLKYLQVVQSGYIRLIIDTLPACSRHMFAFRVECNLTVPSHTFELEMPSR